MTVEEIKRISDKYNELDKLIYEYYIDRLKEKYDNATINRCQYKKWYFSKNWDNEICITYLNPSCEYDNIYFIYLTFEELEKYSEDKL